MCALHARNISIVVTAAFLIGPCQCATLVVVVMCSIWAFIL